MRDLGKSTVHCSFRANPTDLANRTAESIETFPNSSRCPETASADYNCGFFYERRSFENVFERRPSFRLGNIVSPMSQYFSQLLHVILVRISISSVDSVGVPGFLVFVLFVNSRVSCVGNDRFSTLFFHRGGGEGRRRQTRSILSGGNRAPLAFRPSSRWDGRGVPDDGGRTW